MIAGGDPLDASHLGPEAVRRHLRRHGLEARRSLSQNHLADGEVLEAIVEASAPAPGRRILEIGPGVGILTGSLLRAGAAVTAVEVDPRLVAHLRERFAEALGIAVSDPDAPGALRLIEANALDLALGDLVTPPYELVANLPYHITSPTLHHVLGSEPRPERFVLMLQREVAEQIAAPTWRPQLPVRLRPIPRAGRHHPGRAGRVVRAGTHGRLGRPGRSNAGASAPPR